MRCFSEGRTPSVLTSPLPAPFISHNTQRKVRPNNEQRPRAGERHGTRMVESNRLGRELAHDDVEERDRREGDRDRDPVHRDRAAEPGRGQHRLDQVGDRGLTDPAEPEARERDSELRRRDRVVEPAQGHGGGAGAAAPLGDPHLDLRATHGDERELGRHEVGVGENECDDG